MCRYICVHACACVCMWVIFPCCKNLQDSRAPWAPFPVLRPRGFPWPRHPGPPARPGRIRCPVPRWAPPPRVSRDIHRPLLPSLCPLPVRTQRPRPALAAELPPGPVTPMCRVPAWPREPGVQAGPLLGTGAFSCAALACSAGCPAPRVVHTRSASRVTSTGVLGGRNPV